MKQFDIIRARFAPKRADDLVAQLAGAMWIGREAQWQALWIIEDGEYAGQWAMGLIGGEVNSPGWCPLCDLEEVEPQ